jgi:hypothetical protein
MKWHWHGDGSAASAAGSELIVTHDASALGGFLLGLRTAYEIA